MSVTAALGPSAASLPSVSRNLVAPDARLAAEARSGDPRGLAIEAARTLVSEAFVKPVFAELREGNMAADMFKPGVAERRFRPILDGVLADRVVARSDFPVVRVVADRFEQSIRLRSGMVAAPSSAVIGASGSSRKPTGISATGATP